MAVVPSLAAMAALTLFQNPHTQPEGYSVDYSAYSAPATVIQRRQRRRRGAVTRIAAAIRGWLTRTTNLMSETRDRDQWDTRMFTHVWRQQVMWRQHLMNQIFAWDVAGGQQMPPLLRRRRNMQLARSNYRSTSRNRTFGNIPLGMQ